MPPTVGCWTPACRCLQCTLQGNAAQTWTWSAQSAFQASLPSALVAGFVFHTTRFSAWQMPCQHKLSFTPSLLHSPLHSFTPSLLHTFTHFFTHSFTSSLTHSLVSGGSVPVLDIHLCARGHDPHPVQLPAASPRRHPARACARACACHGPVHCRRARWLPRIFRCGPKLKPRRVCGRRQNINCCVVVVTHSNPLNPNHVLPFGFILTRCWFSLFVCLFLFFGLFVCLFVFVFLVCGWCSASAAVYALVGAHVADTFLNWAEVRLRQLHCLQRVNQWQHPCIGMSSTQHACNTHPSSPLIFLSDFALLHRHTHTRCLSGGFVPGSCLSSLLLICPFPFTIATTTMMKVCLMILKQG